MALSSLLFLIALTAALALTFGGGEGVVEAGKFDPVLVSNMGKSKIGAGLEPALAQAFTTGSNTTGYTVTQIQMESMDAEGDDFTMNICEVDSNTHPTRPAGP